MDAYAERELRAELVCHASSGSRLPPPVLQEHTKAVARKCRYTWMMHSWGGGDRSKQVIYNSF